MQCLYLAGTTTECLLRRGVHLWLKLECLYVTGNQRFSQKGVQMSCGCHFLQKFKENSLSYSLVILWENMPSGHPLFNVWLKASGTRGPFLKRPNNLLGM